MYSSTPTRHKEGPTLAGQANEKQEKRDLHLIVSREALRKARIKCAEHELDLSTATNLLWELWFDGKVSITPQQSTRKPHKER